MTPKTPKGKPVGKGGASKSRVKRNKQPTQRNPKGIRVMILGANGKIRWGWQ